MTTLRQAAQQALEALKPHSRNYQRNAAIEALSAALEKHGQEPVCGNTYGCLCPKHYTAPPRREWRGLTTQEAMALTATVPSGVFYGTDPGNGMGIWLAAVVAAEKALKEKNNV